jgi:hypothetical protein
MTAFLANAGFGQRREIALRSGWKGKKEKETECCDTSAMNRDE